MKLQNLTQLYSVYHIKQKTYQTAGSSNNFIKWLFSSEQETGTETLSETLSNNNQLTTPISIVSVAPAQSTQSTEPTQLTSITDNKRLMIIFVGLPKCGKTQLSIDILNKLKQFNLKTKYVETPSISDNLINRKYLDNVKRIIGKNMDVIICNGNNFDEKIRKPLIELAKKNNYNILFVDFKHPEDEEGTFVNYKKFCNTMIEARTDLVAVNTDLDKAVSSYKQLSTEELDGNEYLKIYVNSEKSKNTNDIVLKVKSIFNV